MIICHGVEYSEKKKFLNYVTRAAESDDKTVSILQNILVWICLIIVCHLPMWHFYGTNFLIEYEEIIR